MRTWLQARSYRLCWSMWCAAGALGLLALVLDGAAAFGVYVGAVGLIVISCVASVEKV